MSGMFTINQSGSYLIEYGAQASIPTDTIFSIALLDVGSGTVIPNTSFTSDIRQNKPGDSTERIGIVQLAYFPNDALTVDIDVAAYLDLTRVGDMVP
jgi:hypothetical protein